MIVPPLAASAPAGGGHTMIGSQHSPSSQVWDTKGDIVEFSNPPAPRVRGRSEKWENTVRELKANPNEWGLVGNYSPGLATHIRQGRYPSFVPAGTPDPRRYMEEHWEVTTRKTDQGRRCDMWIRWIGGNEA